MRIKYPKLGSMNWKAQKYKDMVVYSGQNKPKTRIATIHIVPNDNKGWLLWASKTNLKGKDITGIKPYKEVKATTHQQVRSKIHYFQKIMSKR